MAARKLIGLAGLALALCGAAMPKSCQTDMARVNAAAKREGVSNAAAILPDLPPSCTAKMERVYPKVGEKARWTQKRWEFSADKRDGLAEDCGVFWNIYKKRVGAK